MQSTTNGEKLKVLVLAPHPFFINRGTPIDVLLVVRALSERGDTDVDMLVYPEGEDVDLPRVRINRVPFCGYIKNVRPGFSLKKLYIDFFMLFSTWKRVHQKRYSLLHAGEESVFIAMLMKWIYGIPYIYDIDSSIAQQLVEKNQRLKPLAQLFNWFEKKAMSKALACAPVCHALRELCEKNKAAKIVTLHDISQLRNPDLQPTGLLRKEIQKEDLAEESIILLYCGNLERYQGIDLLVESLPHAISQEANIELVIIGGVQEDIERYRTKAEGLGVASNIHFLGPRPFEQLDSYLVEADILVAPRIKGVNTPMKIFPYLHSGKPVLLTKLYTHTQIVTDREAFLAEPDAKSFGAAILQLAKDPDLRNALGARGRSFVEKDHVYSAHKKRVDKLYNWVKMHLYPKTSEPEE